MFKSGNLAADLTPDRHFFGIDNKSD